MTAQSLRNFFGVIFFYQKRKRINEPDSNPQNEYFTLKTTPRPGASTPDSSAEAR